MQKFIDESWLVLAMGIVFGGLLAGAHSSLLDTIQANQDAALNQAIAAVVPGTTETEVHEVPVESLGNKTIQVFECRDAGGNLVGWAIDHSGPGFIDKIRVVAGINPGATEIIGIKALEHIETPGLGTKIEGVWADQFKGLSTAQKLTIVKRQPAVAEEIEAITGATYSSQYVTDIVNEIIIDIRPQLDALR
jgi:RnfABCDGE-type electron transport complex G subunit